MSTGPPRGPEILSLSRRDTLVIYVCVPVREEAATLGPLLWKLRKVLTGPEFRRDFHVLVLDDASGDDTPQVLQRYAEALPLSVVRAERSLGYGAALDRLLRQVAERSAYPKRDAAVVLQGDFTEDPAAVVDLVKLLEGGADIVAAAPEAGGPLPRPLRWARALAPWILGGAHARAPVRDPLCGLRAYRVVVLRKALRDDEPLCSAEEPWAASLELLARTAPHARRIDETPTVLRYGLRVRPSRFRAMRALRSLARLRGAARWERPTEEAA
jgi:glycosyltransferase involved in cell wall biosynthesis